VPRVGWESVRKSQVFMVPKWYHELWR